MRVLQRRKIFFERDYTRERKIDFQYYRLDETIKTYSINSNITAFIQQLIVKNERN